MEREICAGRNITALADYHGEFDLISALDVSEHVPKPRVVEFLTLALGALRSGGTLLCQVPNLAAFYSPLFFIWTSLTKRRLRR